MKVFVSGQINDKPKIQDLYTEIIALGHTITHDWTVTDNLEAFEKDSVEAKRRAKADITGVCEAEIYIIVASNDVQGKGMYVELGAALALVESGRPMEVLVVGPMQYETIFYHHPYCTQFENEAACLAYIKEKLS